MIDDMPTLIFEVRGNYAKGAILKSDLTAQPCFIAKVGNSFAHGETLKEAVADATAKDMEQRPLSDRIALMKEQMPDADTEAPFDVLYNWHHVLTGSCRAGRDAFCLKKGIDREASYTVRYFLNLTKDAYGREAIREAAKAYGIELQ